MRGGATCLSINQSIILFADTNVSQWAHAIQRSIDNKLLVFNVCTLVRMLENNCLDRNYK